MKKIGIDFHGVLDLDSDKFRTIAKFAVKAGHEVHILTGSSWEKFIVESHGLLEEGTHYTHFFSVCDYLIEKGVENRGNLNFPMFDSDIWNEAKGEYAFYTGLDEHFDDCEIYATNFPKTCVFHLVKDGEVVC